MPSKGHRDQPDGIEGGRRRQAHRGGVGHHKANMQLTPYLGAQSTVLLCSEPFVRSKARRSEDGIAPECEICYEFDALGVDVTCDSDGRIRAIFVHRWAPDILSHVPFSLRRSQVIDRLGTPSKSGAASHHAILGPSGAWDRFDSATHSIHIEYAADADEVELITLMRRDVVP